MSKAKLAVSASLAALCWTAPGAGSPGAVTVDDLDFTFSASFAVPGKKGPVTVVRADDMRQKTVSREGDFVKVVWKGCAFAGGDFTVTAKIGCAEKGNRPWSVEYAGASCAEKLFQFDFPVVTRRFTEKSQYLYPYSQGVLVSPDWKNIKVGTAFCKSRMQALSFAAMIEPGGDSWYFDIDCAATDTTKVQFSRAGPDTAEMRLSSLPALRPAAGFSGVYRRYIGAWYEAARIYRARPRAVAAAAAARRRGNPKALREIAMWMWNRGPKENVLPSVVQFQKDSGCPAALDWYWWHAIPYDSGYPNFWPPRDGVEKFRAAVDEAKKAGVFCQVYVNGMAWDMDDPGFKAAGGEDEVIRHLDGTYTGIAFNRYDGHRLAYACGNQPRYSKLHRELLGHLHDSGLSGQYLDQIGCCLGEPCYASNHGHPVGGSPVPGFRRQVEGFRKAFPGWPLCTEDVSETFIDLFDSIICLAPSMETVGWIDSSSRIVPAWAAVYHGLNTVFGNYAMIDHIPPFDPKWPDKDRWKTEKEWEKLFPDQFAAEVVRGVIWGQQPSVHNFRLEHATDARFADDYKLMIDTARFYYANRDLLYDGEMLSPGKMKTAAKKVRFMRRGIYTKDGEYRETTSSLPAVLHSCWKTPKGEKAAVLVNWTREGQSYMLDTPDGRACGDLPPRTWRKVPLGPDSGWKVPDQKKAPSRTYRASPVRGEAPSMLPNGRTWKLVWHDEFNGAELDTSKWGFRTNFWGVNAHWFARPEDGAVEVTNGVARLKIIRRKDGRFASPQLQTGELIWDSQGLNRQKDSLWKFPKREKPKFAHRYGYYECRARLQRKEGWWSAFWMQAPGSGASLSPRDGGVEQDIMESFHPGEIITHAFHTRGYGADYRGYNAHNMPVSIADSTPAWKVDTEEFHNFGLLWEEDGYTVFIDGKQSGGKVTCGGEGASAVEEFIMLTTECKMFRTGLGKGKADPALEAAWKAGDDFAVDFVRVFECATGPEPEAPPAKYANFHAPDIAPVKGEKRLPGWCTVVKGRVAMPIVYNAKSKNKRVGPAADFLADVIFEMTGVRPAVYAERPDRNPVDVAPAFYIGDDVSAFKRREALVKAGLAEPLPTASVEDEEFVVVPSGGSYWFLGRGDHGVFDFADRILGVRQYFLENDIGRFTPKTRGLVVPRIEWRDKPVFAMRSNYPWWASQWGRYLRDSSGGPVSRYPNLHVHPGGCLNRETNFNFGVRSPDIFELTADGVRNSQLCWGNPKTVEAYKEIVTAGIEKRAQTYGIVDTWAQTVTISQLDQGVHCHCRRCTKLYDPSKAPNGDASPCIWGYFAKNISEWLADKYPGWRLVILPYHNTCGCPDGLTFPRGNVTAMLCTMPGLALLKNEATRKHEEELILKWAKATGNKVENWHYSCWPAEFTCAPYVYGSVIQGHYRRLKDHLVGSFLNGGCSMPRFGLSITVWMKMLWNPEINLNAVYDGFADRLFGPAAGPVRKIVDILERGWNRGWANNQCSNKNIYEISYPRREVVEIETLFAEAEQLASGENPIYARRLAYWKEGFERFFKESADYDKGTGFEPLYMKKASEQPKIDGVLDDPTWALATPRKFVPGHDKTRKTPVDGGEVRAVWTTEGVTFGFLCDEHAIEHFQDKNEKMSFRNETFDLFFDPSGDGADAACQLVIDARGTIQPLREDTAPPWKASGFKAAWHVDKPKKQWSCELYVPYTAFKSFNGAKFPTTSANGVVWNGNITRWRVGDSALPKDQRPPDAKWEATRLWTRFNWWNRDPTAFGRFVFVE